MTDWLKHVALVSGLFLLAPISWAADPLPAQTRLVSSSTAPLPTEKEFDVDTAQDLTVTLTDLQTPAALDSLSLVITQADQVATKIELSPPAASASADLTSASGHYTVRVVGAPNAAFGFGVFSVCVAPKASPTNCIQNASLSGNVATRTTGSTAAYIQIEFTVAAAGNYTFTFADHQFPAPLALALSGLVAQGSSVISAGIASGAVLPLGVGNYTLLLVTQTDAATNAGSYGVTISDPALPAVVFDDSFAAGALAPPEIINNSASQTLTWRATDFQFPAALTSAAGLVTAGGTSLGTASAGAGDVSFAAPAGTLKVWHFATAAADAGTYELDLNSGGESFYSNAFGASAGDSFAYAFKTAPLASGAYQVTATDFEFPSTLQSIKFAAAQGGVLLAQSATAGGLDVNAGAGALVLLVAAQTPASGNGLFDVNVASGGSLLFDKTQGVGAAGIFDSQTITLGTSAGFDVTLADLKFPDTLTDLALVASYGGQVLGKIFGGGTFSFAGTPGPLQLTFIATPASAQMYGLYAIKVVASAPTITISASPVTLVAGDPTTLSWSAQDADTCTASGGNWSGGKAVSSSTESVRVDATTTFTLTCVGAGGTSAKSVNVTATPKPAKSGGGGAFDWGWLVAFGAVVAALRWRSRADGR